MKYVLIIMLLTFAQYVNAQTELNQFDSLGKKTGNWVWVPDSVDMFWPKENMRKNNGKELETFFIDNKIMQILKDTTITIHANFRNGKMHGEVLYMLDNKYPYAKGSYQNGLRDGVVFIYRGNWEILYMILTYCQDKREGFEITYSYGEISVGFYVNNERIFEADNSNGKAFLVPYEDGDIKNGKYLMEMYNGDYKILKYRNGKWVKVKYIYSENNTVKDYSRKSGERPYYWGYVLKIFTNQKETRFQRWIKRRF